MRLALYAIKDQKFAFSEVFPSRDDSSASRYFAMLINNAAPNNVMNFAPKDFDLYQVGKFDSETGQIDSVWPIEFVVNGSSLVGDVK